MTLLPYERLALRVDGTPELVAARLAEMVTSRRTWFRRPPEPFRGAVRGTRFKVVRVLGPFARNSFQPVIEGEIVPAPDGAEVRVRMRLDVLVGAFMCVWFAGALFAVGALAFMVFRGVAEVVPGVAGGVAVLLGAGAIPVLGYALMTASFRAEVRKARELLCEGLGCRDAPPRNRLLRT